MRKIITYSFFLIIFCGSCQAQSSSIEILRQKINQMIQNKSATIGVSIQGMNPKDTISINGNRHLAMQSVYKFHLALAVLHQIDEGKFNLTDTIYISAEKVKLYQNLWSPLRKDYPNGGKFTVAKIMEYTVGWSDNLGCDVLFDKIGGTQVVQSYSQQLGIKDIAIVDKEISLQSDWQRQYQNWTTPNASTRLLKLFHENDTLLSETSYNFLLKTLKETLTGKKGLKGLLPKNTVVAHKTGNSGKNNKGLAGAVNNIGIVFLPNGNYFYISVFVSNSTEEDNQKIIAEIAKCAWDYFESNP